MKLPVATIHPKGTTPAAGAIVFLVGGPGSSSLANVPDFLTRDFGARDVIVFEQRGAVLAEPSLACPEANHSWYDAQATADLALRRSVISAGVKACHDRLVGQGINLATYNSLTDANDVADLRVAMGIDSWDVWGASYGTQVALEAVRSHPKGIRSLILESALPPNAPNTTTEYLTTSLRQLFDGCASSPTCSTKHPQFEADTHQVVAALDAAPFHGNIHDNAGAERPIVVTGGDALNLLWFSMFDPRVIPNLPSIIETLRNGDYGYLNLVTELLAPPDTYSYGLDLSYQCAADAPPPDTAATLAAHPEYAAVVAQDIRQDCAVWNVPLLPSSFHQPVTSDVPALVLADEYDPYTPPALGTQTVTTLPHATLVVFPGLGHEPTFSGGDLTACPRSILTRFVADPSALLSTSCVAELGPPVWT